MPEFKNSLKRYLLKNAITDLIPGSENSVLFFIARPESWSGGVPSTYQDDVESFYDVYRRMIAAKKITSLQAALMIPKNEWRSGVTFDMYTSDKDLSDNTRFYTTTSTNNVYKCIYNGATGSSALVSTVEPSGTSNSIFKTSDGYKWQYMYSIPSSLDRFTTTSEIAVKTLDLDEDDPLRYKDDRFPQYNLQYNAVRGSLSLIEVLNTGASYGGSRASENMVSASNTGTTSAVVLNGGATTGEGFYEDYLLRVVSGPGVGQKKRIDGYSGGTRTAKFSDNWTILPDASSKYEIIPEIEIKGDGTGADAIAVMNGVTLGTVDLLNAGSGYSYVTATIRTPNSSGATLDPHLAPRDGHGYDPEMELLATKIQILVRLDGQDSRITGDNRDGSFPANNNYHQYGLIRNPIFATGDRRGEVVGIQSSSLTDIVIDAATGSVFGAFDLVAGDFVIGETSKSAGEVSRFARSTDTRRATITIKDNKSAFVKGERVIGLGTGAVWTSSGKAEGYFKYSEDTVPLLESDTYRLTTKLIVETTGADTGVTWSRTDITLDHVLIGASGASASVVEFMPHPDAVTADLYVTTIYRGETAGAYGFTAGELFTSTSLVSKVSEIDIPIFEFGSGEILYVNNVGGIERSGEQEEEFKITIDI